MTVHTYFSSIFETHIEKIHYSHHVLKSCTCHVLPTLVETVNSMSIESLRNIAESNFRDDSVSAVRMLSWLLEVEYCSYVFGFEFLVYVILLYQSLGGPLHCEDVLGYPVGVETFDGVGLLFVGEVVLVGTLLSPAELAQKDGFLVELLDLEKLDPGPIPQSLSLIVLHIML